MIKNLRPLHQRPLYRVFAITVFSAFSSLTDQSLVLSKMAASSSAACPGFPCVVFKGRRNAPHSDSYEVDFFDHEKVQRTWKNGHGAPHVRTPQKIKSGTARKCEAVPNGFDNVQSMRFASKNREMASSKKKLYMWAVNGCSSPQDTKDTTSCHITIPLEYAPEAYRDLIETMAERKEKRQKGKEKDGSEDTIDDEEKNSDIDL
ncbi:unnamed protein product [Amoebophrya sp. A25]|nr:unnamed protein product [Amoebophrya sp. A25]|eukprot:GSA25T00002210001.1